MKIALKCGCGAEGIFEDETGKLPITLSGHINTWIDAHRECKSEKKSFVPDLQAKSKGVFEENS
jgi:hypothetical protein